MVTQPPLPSADEAVPWLTAGGRPALYLDYDGTLTPIVARPELAILAPSVRDLLARLAPLADVAVISGRDLEDVRRLLGVPGITVAGSHGFEVEHPDGRRLTHGGGEAFLPALDDAAAILAPDIDRVPGARLERKRFALAVHYREAAAPRHAEVLSIVTRVAEALPRLRLGHGKMVVELRPAADWDKGRLVAALLAERDGSPPGPAAYLGDDVTDEDAFEVLRALEPPGLAVVVGERALGQTAATHALPGVAAVAGWLDRLATQLAR